MKTNQKFIILSLCIFTLFSSNIQVVAQSHKNMVIEPYYLNLKRAEVQLSTSSNRLTFKVDVIAVKNCTLSISAYLQRYTNGNWVNIKSWYTSNDSAKKLTLSKSYTSTRNHKYRISATIKCNNEQIKKYSNVVSY